MLLQTKLKNAIKRITDIPLEFHLKNISVNGQRRGCSGFIVNPENNRIVYVNTEKSCYQPLKDKNLFRLADSIKDYSGHINQWATDAQLARAVINLLTGSVNFA